MTTGGDGFASRGLALLRAGLLVVIVPSVLALDARRLGGAWFAITAMIAGVLALAGIVLAFTDRLPARSSPVQSAVTLILLACLAMSSGGAFSDARRVFVAVPFFAALQGAPRAVARWALAAMLAFTAQAVIVGGHPPSSVDSWQRLTIIEDLYMAWAAAGAVLLAVVLRDRQNRIGAIAESRKRLVTEAIASVERERTRLAGALHDRPVQGLIAARHNLRRAERDGEARSFTAVREALDEVLAELREEIFRLHPHVLDHVGLDAAIRQLAQRHVREDGLEVALELDPAAAACHADLLFWLARELLSNAAQHAGAEHVSVRLATGPEGVSLEVTDDGAGIPDGRLRAAVLAGHVGLASATERVTALGGAFSITTAPAAGTMVAVTLPLERSEVAPDDGASSPEPERAA